MILLDYTQDRNRPSLRIARRFIWVSLIGFCLFYGLLFAFFAPYLMVPFAVPPLILAIFVIWALPDSHSPPTSAMSTLLFAFVASLVAWPNYVALALPGLPWITLARIIDFPLAFIVCVCASTSKDFRTTISTMLRDASAVRYLFLVFLVLQVISLGFSTTKAESLQKYAVAQTGWTAVFFASLYVFAKPGRAEQMAKTMWALAIFVGLIGLVEWRLERVLWAGHIPSFLKIEDPSVAQTLSGFRRLSNGRYRVLSTFGTPLGLGEYMALTLPLVMHFAVTARSRAVKIAARITVPFILFVAFVSGSRLGLIGCLLGVVFYGAVLTFLFQRRNPGSLWATSTLLAFPAVAAVGGASIAFVGRLRHIVWGTGAQAYSDQSRQAQLTMGIPLILKHPWGYGIGRAGETLGYAPFGFLTIDNYYLSIALDYGVLGFIAYYGMFVAAIFYCGRQIVTKRFNDPELELLTAVAIALVNFVIVKSVFSEESNHPIVFMLLGMSVALVHRAGSSAAATIAQTGSDVSVHARNRLPSRARKLGAYPDLAR